MTRLPGRLLRLGIALCAVLPMVRIVRILAMNGSDVPSSDDIRIVHQFLGPALSGKYNWLDLPRATFLNDSHVSILPALVYFLTARLDHLNTYHILYMGIAITAGGLILVHQALTKASAKDIYWWLLWPVLSCLVFSVSQISEFEHPFESLKNGFTILGLGLGMWALVRLPPRWAATLLMVLAAVIVSLSCANGMLLWPLFLAAMAFYRFDSKRHYAVVLLAGMASAALYVRNLFSNSGPGPRGAFLAGFNVSTMINTLGRPFARNVGR